MKTILEENYYEVSEAATLLDKTPKTVLKMISDGRLSANTQTRPFLISERSIKDFLGSKGTAKPVESY